MKFKTYSFKDLLKKIVDNRGKTCPTSDTGIPLIATNCVKNNTLFPAFEKVRYVDEETYNTWFRGHPEPGDMIFVCKGSPGQVCWTPDPVGFCIAQDMVAIRADETKVYPKYLFALLRAEQSQQKILNMHVGTLIPHFKKGDFGNLYFDIPEDMEYQKVVGDAYFDFCQKIHLNTQTNQTLESIAQAIFKSWFVDFEPVKGKMAVLAEGGTREQADLAAMGAISGKSEAELAQLQQQNSGHYQQLAETAALFPSAMIESELGGIPEGWETKALYDTAEYINGGAFKTEQFSQDQTGLPIIKIAELKQGITDSTKFTQNDFNSKISIDNGEILYSWSGSPETSLEVFKWFSGKGWLNQHIFKLVFNSENEKYFTFYLLKFLKPLLIETAKQKQTTGLGHITVADMKRIKTVSPSPAVLKKFCNIISPMFNKASSLDIENIQLSQLRDYLLPKLLAGELTIPLNEGN